MVHCMVLKLTVNLESLKKLTSAQVEESMSNTFSTLLISVVKMPIFLSLANELLLNFIYM